MVLFKSHFSALLLVSMTVRIRTFPSHHESVM